MKEMISYYQDQWKTYRDATEDFVAVVELKKVMPSTSYRPTDVIYDLVENELLIKRTTGDSLKYNLDEAHALYKALGYLLGLNEKWAMQEATFRTKKGSVVKIPKDGKRW